MNTLPRRRFLRGMLGGGAFALGLPVLEAMLNRHGTAMAGGEPLPLRFGTWYFGNGIPPESWTPATTGPDWVPTECLMPLGAALIKPYVAVVSGTDLGIGFGDHIMSRAVALAGSTNSAPTGAQADSASAMPSCDQIAADLLGASTTFRSVELGVSRAGTAGLGADEFSCSFTGPQLLPAEFSPQALFDRMFLGFSPDTRQLDTRVGVIDVIKADADELRMRLGAADKQRLDAHLAGLDDLETRLLSEPPTCAVPAAPGTPADDGTNEPLQARSQLLCDVLAQAIACDLVRVFSVRFSQAISDTFFWEAGVNEGLHTITHDPGKRTQYAASVNFTMQQLAYLLGKLQAIPEGDGNVLDRCAIFCTSELSDGQQHTVTDYPVLVAGTAGGRLKVGHHLALPGVRTSAVPLTMLRAVGVEAASYGDATYGATDSIAELTA
ncbi:MAG: DUF1552 domain-containing protein [Deltaproteobacteria bacterium]|nr:DUF1552 domain-containing protein [Nannocystaceae bacterium]